MNIGGKLTQCECYCGCKAVAFTKRCLTCATMQARGQPHG